MPLPWLALLWCIVLLVGAVGVWTAIRGSGRAAVTLIALMLAAGIARTTPSPSWYGLEYEDAFVYAAAARYDAVSPGRSTQITVCVVGSLADCEQSESYPGHQPAFAALLVALQGVLPWTPQLPMIVGAALGIVATAFIWWACLVAVGSESAAAWAALLHATTPVLALYGGSACAEAASGVAIATAIGSVASARRATSEGDRWFWYACSLAAVALAVLVKRENVVLLAVVPMAWKWDQPLMLRTGSHLGAMLMWFATLGVLVPNLWNSAVAEVGEYGTVSFGLERFWTSVPTVIGALFQPRWFGLLAVAATVGCMIAWSARKGHGSQTDAPLLSAVSLCAAVMVASYASHVRSTYQLMGVPLTHFDFLRYLSNGGVFLCLLASVPFVYAVSLKHRRASALLLVAYGVVASLQANALRTDLIRDEHDTRVAPALAALEVAREFDGRYPLASFEPMLLQVYGDSDARVLSMASLSAQGVQQLGGRLLVVRQEHYDSPEDRSRYAGAFAALPEYRQVLRSGHGWSIDLVSTTALAHR